MQRGKVLRLQTFGILEFFKNNSFLLAITFVFTVGVFIGVFSFDNFKTLNDYSKEYITDYILSRQTAGFGVVFKASLLKQLSVLFLYFLLGASLFGVITIPTCMLVKGIMQGGLTALLYSEYGLKGIAFNAVILIPTTIAYLIVLLFAGREAIRFSLKFSSLTLNKTLPFNMSQDFKEYSIRFLILAAAFFICALIDAAITTGLIKHFTL